jgi:membrane protein implicated in regulation of membrane protease activity
MSETAWWFVVAAAFVLVEFGHRAFFALFIALGAIVAAVLAVAGAPVEAQIPAFVAAAVGGVLLVRPSLQRAMSRGHYRLISGAEGLVGKEAVVTEEVGDITRPGRIRIQGEQWKALSSDGGPIEAGHVVMILELQGSTFVVSDLHALGLTPLELPDET